MRVWLLRAGTSVRSLWTQEPSGYITSEQFLDHRAPVSLWSYSAPRSPSELITNNAVIFWYICNVFSVSPNSWYIFDNCRRTRVLLTRLPSSWVSWHHPLACRFSHWSSCVCILFAVTFWVDFILLRPHLWEWRHLGSRMSHSPWVINPNVWLK